MIEARELAQQKPDSGDWRLYWYSDEAVVKGSPRREADMAAYEIDSVLDGIVRRQSMEPERAAAERNS